MIKKIKNAKITIDSHYKSMDYQTFHNIYKGKLPNEAYHVTMKGVQLTEGIDYIVKYKNNAYRDLWDSFYWPWNTLICDYSCMNNYYSNENCTYIIRKIKEIELKDIYTIRGDARAIAEYFNM